ncbi:putative amine oxidase [Helianthus annuus]|nr:putative amine oxidase [Helianthus annuus]
MALVAGEAAHSFESMPPTDAVTRILQILRGIYEPQGIEVPEPIQTVCTRWGSDPFSLGSYSNVAVGSSGGRLRYFSRKRRRRKTVLCR